MRFQTRSQHTNDNKHCLTDATLSSRLAHKTSVYLGTENAELVVVTGTIIVGSRVRSQGCHFTKVNFMNYKSIAVWPDGTVSNIKNESEDTHETYEHAEAVCKLLRIHGFGGMGKVFPISTRVEPIK